MARVRSIDAPAPRKPEPLASRVGIFVLLAIGFALSGAAALVYQVVWSRRLQYVFGSTTEAVAVVLMVFMAGLGGGAAWLGRRADRSSNPLRLYGFLEAGIGVFGAISPWLLDSVDRIFRVAAPGDGSSFFATSLKIALATVVLAPPCLLMGGTLPALVRATAAASAGGSREVAVLYAANLGGALLGAAAAGFWLLEHAGLSISTRLAAAANLAVAGIAWAIASKLGAPKPEALPAEADFRAGPASATEPAESSLYRRCGLFFSGAIVLALEVVSTRVLVTILGVSAHAVALVLLLFLVGLALGAVWSEFRPWRGSGTAARFGASQLAAAAGLLLLVDRIPALPRALAWIRQVPGLGYESHLVAKALLASVALLPVAILAGVGTPLLLAASTRHSSEAGRRVGDGYLINTAGAMVGSLAAGFLLVPLFGSERSLRALALLQIAFGATGLLVARRSARFALPTLATAGLLAWGAVASAAWPVAVFLDSDSSGQSGAATTVRDFEDRIRAWPHQVLFLREGRNATVAVTQTPRVRSLLVNGHADGSDSDTDMSTQVFLGFLPLAIHPRPERVLVIGYGTGVSARAAARFDEVRSIDVVEIEPAVLAASRFFESVNGGVLRDPRTKLAEVDARTYVALAKSGSFDVVVSEPSNPWRAGVANLYTREFFLGIRRILRPGGLHAQWMHLYSVRPDDFRLVLRTLASVFPNVEVWWLDQGNVVLLASDNPPKLDHERILGLLNGSFRRDSHRYAGLARAEEFFARRLLDGAAVDELVAASPEIHTDDHPILEFRAPRGLFEADADIASRLLGEKLRRGLFAPPSPGSQAAPAADWIEVSRMWEILGHPDAAREAAQQALAGGTVWATLRAAELELAGDRYDAALQLLASDQPRDATADVAAAWIEARADAALGDVSDARRAYAATGELDGNAGAELVQLLVRSRQMDEAMGRALRLVALAGDSASAVDLGTLELLYPSLLDLADNPDRAKTILEAVRRLGAMNRFPALNLVKLEAYVLVRLGRDEEALSTVRRVRGLGIVDVAAVRLERGILSRLGRTGEATRIEAELRHIDPEALASDPLQGMR